MRDRSMSAMQRLRQIAITWLLGFASLAVGPAAILSAQAQDRPARGYAIALHVSTSKAPATGPEEAYAIVTFVKQRVAAINAAGGIHGRPVELVIYDDKTEAERTVRNVADMLKRPNLIAMIGVWNSTRGSKVVARVGESGLPWISEMSVESLFAPYPNVYTLTHSVLDEQQVFKSFVADRFQRVAFVGNPNDLYTSDYYRYLADMPEGTQLVTTNWLKSAIADRPQAVEAVIADLKAASPDLLFLSIGSKQGAQLLARLAKAGINVPVFIALGSVNGVTAEQVAQSYRAALYEIAEGGIANLNNERLEQLMRRPGSLGRKHAYAPYSVGYGARYADLVSLIVVGARRSANPDAGSVRHAVAAHLAQLQEGRQVFRGTAQDWSFSNRRASSERSLIVWRPPGKSTSLLAPTQYVRRNGKIVQVPVLYMHLDMNRIDRIDSNDRSFEAEFFFTIRSDTYLSIGAIEFTNALRGPMGQPLINIREVHVDPKDATQRSWSRIYKVNGRFAFDPDLRKYPFDNQVLSVSFQPSSTRAAFLIQPPADEIRNKAFSIDGWTMLSHYVGTSEQLIRSVEGATSEQRVLPYYNFNYTWVMRRQVIDYVLRVIVPLAFIMIVAYLANFIPNTQFESIIAIQVTALLSAIALYLALNQPAADDATLSDMIFVTTYATISVMIALSIFQVNPLLTRARFLRRLVKLVQIVVVPIVATVAMGQILASAYDFDSLSDALRAGFNQLTRQTPGA